MINLETLDEIIENFDYHALDSESKACFQDAFQMRKFRDYLKEVKKELEKINARK